METKEQALRKEWHEAKIGVRRFEAQFRDRVEQG
jgi:hypothetical protein